MFDAAGNIYGATINGGAYNGRIVFELVPRVGGSSYNEKILYSFPEGPDGGNPLSGLIFDGAGNLFGTTYAGGSGIGVVFEVIP